MEWNGFRVVAGNIEDDTKATKSLVDQLNSLLADVSLFYHTAHEFHWNVRGTDFYEYHKFYDEIVEDVYNSIDPIAENIRKLNGNPKYNLHEILSNSTLTPANNESFDTKSLTKELARLNSGLITILNQTFSVADRENQQGVANFIAERIDMHQKWQWFLTSSGE